MREPISNDVYYNYLKKRSTLGLIYRKYYLYPRLKSEMSGLALDIGCGIGDFLKSRPNTVGVDVNPNLVAYCRSQGLNAKHMEPHALPFPSDSFDCVMLDNVLEHISNPHPLLYEIARVTKANGRLVVGVPGLAGYKSDPDHKVYYSAESLQSTLAAHGWMAMKLFRMPIQLNWLDTRLRQYCVYGVFSIGVDLKS